MQTAIANSGRHRTVNEGRHAQSIHDQIHWVSRAHFHGRSMALRQIFAANPIFSKFCRPEHSSLEIVQIVAASLSSSAFKS